MVAVIAGNGLGLLGTSASALGTATGGQAGVGQSGASQYVNVATGNLVLAQQDERLVAQGLMAGFKRTYNSLGANGDMGAGGWLLGLDRRLGNLTGTLDAAGSSITRDGGDGEEQRFAYDSARGLYVAPEKDGASDTLRWNTSDDSWTYTAGDSRREETYDAAGTLKGLRDGKTGAAYSLSYNANQQLASVTADDGEALLLEYDAAGRVSGLSTWEIPAGGGSPQAMSHVRYGYDTLGRLASVTTDLTPQDSTDASAFTTTYSYEGESLRLASLSQSDGGTVGYTYAQDSQGAYRIASVTTGSGAEAQTQAFSYDLAARTTTVTDAGGRAWTYGYDGQGNLTTVTSPAVDGQRQVTTYTYTPDGQVASVTDDLGNATVYEYDARGNRTLERDAAGNTTDYTYGNDNQVLTRTVFRVPDPDGAGATQASDPSTTRYVYDNLDRLRYAIDADGGVQETQYNEMGLASFTRSYTGASFDASALDPALAPNLATMDGWSASQDLSQTSRTDYGYDAAGRLASSNAWSSTDSTGTGVADSGAVATRYVYDAQGLLRQKVTQRGTAFSQTVSYSYDGLGRLLGQTDATGATTTYTYRDGQGTLAITQANGLVRTQARDSAGELVAVTESASGEATRRTQYIYDSEGQLRAVRDAGGAVTYSFYDAAGRLAGTVDATGAVTRYGRDGDGRIVTTTRYATRINTTAWLNGGLPAGMPGDIDAALPTAQAADRTSITIYDAAGRAACQVDADGYATTYAYDGAGNLTCTTAHATALTTVQLDSLKAAPGATVLDTELATSANDRSSYAFYDVANRQVAVLDAAGYVTTTAYNAAGLVAKTVGYARGLTASQRSALGTAPTLAAVLADLSGSDDDQATRSYYDGRGRLVAQIDPAGYLTTTRYDEPSHSVQVTRYADVLSAGRLAGLTGHESPQALDSYVSGSAFEVHTRQYDQDDRLAAESHPDGSVTDYSYDDVGNLVGTVTTPAAGGQVRGTSATYDAFGEATATTDAAGATTTYAYDVRGQRVLTTDPLGNKTWNFYDASGRLAYTVKGIAHGGVSNALGEVTALGYDAFGEVTTTTQVASMLNLVALGLDTGTTLDALSTAVAAIAAPTRDASSTNSYTHTGHLAGTRDGLGYATAIAYDAFGEVVRTQHQLSQAGQALDAGNSVSSTYRYDARGLRVGQTDDAGAIDRSTATSYDAFGRITAQTDARGNVRSFGYDTLGRQVTTGLTVQGVARATHTSYDAYGRVLAQTDALGQTTHYAYSADTHTVHVTLPDGLTATTVTDAYGDTLSMTDGDGHTIAYSYDADGRLLSTTDASGRVEHDTYDNLGELIRHTDADGRVVSYTYDADGHVLTRTVDPDGRAQTTRYAYDGRGQRFSTTDADGSITIYGYDADGRLFEQVADVGGLDLVTTYAWDGAGNQLSVTEGAGTADARTTAYTYDRLGRRTKAVVDPAGLALTTGYTYDDNDNLVAVTDPDGNVSRTVYDEANQPLYTVDPAGAVEQYYHDADGRVTATRSYAAPIDLTGLPPAVTPAQVSTRLVASAADPRRYTVYDAAGRVLYTIDPLGYITEQRHDIAGRVSETIAYAVPLAGTTVASLDQALREGTAAVKVALALAATANTEAGARASVNLYDDAGRVRFVVRQDNIDGERVGLVTERRYDGAGHVVAEVAYGATLPLGNGTLAPQLTTDGVAQALATAPSQVTRTVYDAAGLARYTIDAAGHVAEQRYDADGRLTETLRYLNPIDVPGAPTEANMAAAVAAANSAASTRFVQTTYDAAGRVVQTADALGITASYSYDATGLKTRYTDRDGATWTYAYDAAGRLAAETSPAVAAASYTTGNTLDVVTAGLVTSYAYDANGNVLRRTEAAGTPAARTISYAYDSRGNQIRTTYPDAGYVDSTGTYQATSPIGATHAQVTYDALGHAVVNRDVAGHYSYKVYDGRGQVGYEVDADGYVTAYAYDAYGNRTQVTRYALALDTSAIAGWSAGQPLSAGQLLRGLITGPADRTVTTSYDQAGRKVEVAQASVAYMLAEGSNARKTATGAPTTRYSYDAYGNLSRTSVKVQDAYGTPGQAGYDEALWADTTSYYDALNQKVMDVDPMGYVTTYAYDGVGELTRTTEYAHAIGTGSLDPDTRPGLPVAGNAASGYDRTSVVAYDAIGRKASITLQGSFGYVAGHAGLAAGSSVTTYTYDGEDRVTAVTANGATTRTAYDALGRLLSVTEPSRAVLVSNWQSLLEGDATLDLSDAALYTQVSPRTTFTYDALGQAVRTVRSAAGAPTQTQYTHYDALGRQVVSVDAQGTSFFQSYDAAGNQTLSWYTLTGNSGASGAATSATYDANGQRTSSVTTRYEGGDTTTESAQYVRYNAFGEIIGKGSASGTYALTYAYDRSGRLVSGTDAATGVQHTYAYSLTGAQLSDSWALDGSGHTASIAWHLDLDGRRLVSFQPSDTAATGENGAHARYSYDRWGNVLSSTDARGYVTTYQYDSNNKLYQETEPNVLVVATDGERTWEKPSRFWYYDVDGRLAGTRDENGHTSSNTFDAAGQLTLSKDAIGAKTYLAYDGLGRVLARQTPPVATTTEAAVHITWSAYDANDRVIEQGDFGRSADGKARTRKTQQSYLLNTNGDRLRVTDALGNADYYDYDSQHRIVESQTTLQHASGNAETFAYDVNGNKIEHRTANGDHETWTYDDFGRVQTHRDIGGDTTTYDYDAHTGLLMTQTSILDDPLHPPRYIDDTQMDGTATVDYQYYADGQIRQVTRSVDDTVIGSTSYAYDAAGETIDTRTVTTDGAGEQVQTRTQTQYDSHDRISLVTQTDPAATGDEVVGQMRTATVYDAAGNRRAVFTQSGFGPTASAIDLSGNPPSAAAIADQSTAVGDTYSFDAGAAFTDPLAFGLSWKATQADGSALPSWLHFADGVFSGTPSATGQWTITLTGTDIEGRSTSATFSLTVTPPPLAPVLNGSLADQHGVLGEPFELVLPAGTFTSPDGKALSYSAQVLVPAHDKTTYPPDLAAGDGTHTWYPAAWEDIANVGLSIDATTGTISGRPAALAVQIEENPDDFDFYATYELRVTATNAYGPTWAPFQLANSDGSDGSDGGKPAFAGIVADQSAVQGKFMTYMAPAATDANGDPITYRASGLPPGIDFDASTHTFSGTPTTADTWTVTYTATNSVGSTSESFTITVASGTAKPVYNDAYPSQINGVLGQALTIPMPSGAFSAPDGKALSYSAEALIPGHTMITYPVDMYPEGRSPTQVPDTWVDISEAGLSIDAVTGTISGRPTTLREQIQKNPDDYTYLSDYTIKVFASDAGGTVSGQFLLHNVDPNGPAFGSAPAKQTLVLGQSLTYVAPAATDPDGDPITYSASGLPPGVSFNAGTRTFSGTPTTTGSWPVTYTATAGASTAVKTFTIEVDAPASPPPTSSPPTYEGGYTSYSGTIGKALTPIKVPAGAFSSPGGQALSFSGKALVPAHWVTQLDANHDVTKVWVDEQSVSLSQAGLTINASTGTISGTPKTLDYVDNVFQGTHTQVSDYRLEVIASNAAGSASAKFMLSNTVPGPTLATPLADHTVDPGQGAVTIVSASNFTDPSGQGLTYSATLSSGAALPSGLIWSQSWIVVSKLAAGSYSIKVTATDAQGRTAADTFVLTVRNAAPVFGTLSNHSATQKASMASFTLPAATDPNGDTISYSASGMPSGVSFNSATRTFSGTPTVAGNFTITCKATDSHGASSSKTFVLSVAAAPVAGPVYHGGIPGTVTLAAYGDTYTIPAGTFTSPSGLSLTYKATFTATSWLSFNAATRTFTRSLADYTSDTSVKLTVTDSQGHAVSVTFTVEATGRLDGGGRFPNTMALVGTADGASLDPASDPAGRASRDPAGGASPSGNPAARVMGADTGPVRRNDPAASDPQPLALHPALMMPPPDPDDPPVDPPVVRTPNIEADWFTYDADNRVAIANGALVDGRIALTSVASSYELHYDAAGNVTTRTVVNADGHTMVQGSYYNLRNQLVRADYSVDLTAGESSRGTEELRRYDDAGQLVLTARFYAAGTVVDRFHVPSWETDPDAYVGADASGTDVSHMLATATVDHYDADGRLLQEQDFGHHDVKVGTTTVPYTLPDVDDQFWDGLDRKSQVTYEDASGGTGYDAMGHVTHYQYKIGGRVDSYLVRYEKKDGYLESSTSGSSTSTSYTVPADFSYYNVFGERVAIGQRVELDNTVQNTDRVFAYDANGQILQRRDGSATDSYSPGSGMVYGFDATASTHYAYVDGQQVGAVDEAGGIHVADGLTAFSNTQAGSTGYVVQSGDTLKSIAQAQYGNASLWYVVAQANALQSDDDLVAGQGLRLPQVTTTANDATTFKPYNPADIAGSTSAPAVYAPPPPSQHCNYVAAIIIIAVAVIVSVATYGAATEAMATWASSSVGAGVAAGAITGAAVTAAGDAAVQLSGDMLGQRSGFSFKEVLTSGVIGGLTAGAGSASVIGNLIAGAENYAIGYGVDKLMGEPAHFSWAGLVAASAGSAAGAAMGSTNAESNFVGSDGHYFARASQDIVTREVSVMLGDNHVQSWAQIGEDVFGNALGNAAVTRANAYQSQQRMEDIHDTESALLTDEQTRVSGDIGAQMQGAVSGDMDAFAVQASNSMDAAIVGDAQARLSAYADANLGSGAWASSGPSPADAVTLAPMIVNAYPQHAYSAVEEAEFQRNYAAANADQRMEQEFARVHPPADTTSQSVMRATPETWGQKLYATNRRALLFDRASGAAANVAVDMIGLKAMEGLGDVAAGWSALWDKDEHGGFEQGTNFFTGRTSWGTETWDERFISGANLATMGIGTFSEAEIAAGDVAVSLRNIPNAGVVDAFSSIDGLLAPNVYHLTTSPGAAENVSNGIDPVFLSSNNRFGAAFYVTEQPETGVAELVAHDNIASSVVTFSTNNDAANILDLTNRDIAAEWEYDGNNGYPLTKPIASHASALGYNVIRYPSEQISGAVNYAILDDYNDILIPVTISPVKP